MIELYTERLKQQQIEPEIYEYDIFPIEFRTQLFYIISDVLNLYDYVAWTGCYKVFLREKGLKYLTIQGLDERCEFERYIDTCTTNDMLDLIDFIFNVIDKNCRKNPPQHKTLNYYEKLDNAIYELNHRFKQHNLGYEFYDGVLIRKDNKMIHEKTIKPALKLLIDNNFSGANQEFVTAFQEFRQGNNKGAIMNALKAFESTMKTICEKMNYPYNKSRDTAKDLIKILEDKNFYPQYMNSHINSLRTTLESGLPTVRNKNAGHGQGENIVTIPDEFAEYAINLAATNIAFLVGIYQSK